MLDNNFTINLSFIILNLFKLIDSINSYTYNETNWISFDERTFYYISGLENATDWQKADRFCRRMGSNLVSIHDRIQNEFLVNQTNHLRHDFWIGLSGDRATHQWLDGKDFDYNQLVDVMPDNGRKCATFLFGSGVWKYNNCLINKFGYICQKINEDHSQYHEKPRVIKFGHHDYTFFNKTRLDWNRAKEECAKINGSNLLSIVSSSEIQFIRNYILFNFKSTDFWIGLNAKTNSSQLQYQWSDGSAVNMTYWKTMQPLIDWRHQTHNCVYQMGNTSEWTVDLCTRERQFICKSSAENIVPKPKKYLSYGCPSNSTLSWIDIDTDSEFCYWFSENHDSSLLQTTWAEASVKCQSHYSTLVSIHSSESLEKLMNRITKQSWIGLRINEKGYIKWEDSTELDFTNWDNITIVSKSDKNCFTVEPNNSFKWSLKQCFDKSTIYDYICQTRKVLIQVDSHSSTETTPYLSTKPYETTNHVMNTTNTSTNSSQLIDRKPEPSNGGLPSLAKYGLILLGLIILLSVSFNVYIVGKKVKLSELFKSDTKPKTRTKTDRRQRDSDALNSSDPNVVFSNIRLK